MVTMLLKVSREVPFLILLTKIENCNFKSIIPRKFAILLIFLIFYVMQVIFFILFGLLDFFNIIYELLCLQKY